MKIVLRILGIILVVVSLLLLLAVPAAGVIGIVIGVLCIIRSNQKLTDKITAYLAKSREKSEQRAAEFNQKYLELKQQGKIKTENSPQVSIGKVIYSEREIPDVSPLAIQIREKEEKIRKNIEQRHNTLLHEMIPQIEKSPYIKPDKKQILIDMLNKTSKMHDPFSYEDCLTAEEKKSFGINARLKISRQMIDFLTNEGLKLENPKEVISSIYYNIYSKYEEEWEGEDEKERNEKLMELALETQKRMQSSGLKFYVWSTCGDERVCDACKIMDEKLCRWESPFVYSEDSGKIWKRRPKGAKMTHPGQGDGCTDHCGCRCTSLAYEPELLGEM
ncbi:MAG: hypothetical protein LBH43_07155 [Treponema sp.]|nr:hypothetical protein [Treponema sp.]